MLEFAQLYAQIALVAMVSVFVGHALGCVWQARFVDDFYPHTFYILIGAIIAGVVWPITVIALAWAVFGKREDA